MTSAPVIDRQRRLGGRGAAPLGADPVLPATIPSRLLAALDRRRPAGRDRGARRRLAATPRWRRGSPTRCARCALPALLRAPGRQRRPRRRPQPAGRRGARRATCCSSTPTCCPTPTDFLARWLELIAAERPGGGVRRLLARPGAAHAAPPPCTARMALKQRLHAGRGATPGAGEVRLHLQPPDPARRLRGRAVRRRLRRLGLGGRGVGHARLAPPSDPPHRQPRHPPRPRRRRRRWRPSSSSRPPTSPAWWPPTATSCAPIRATAPPRR